MKIQHIIIGLIIWEVFAVFADEEMKNGITHPEDGATVVELYPATPDIVAIRIQEMEVIKEGQKKYVAEEKDEIKAGGELVPVWTKNGVSREKINRDLYRNGQRYAHYFEPYGTWQPMIWREYIRGTPLKKNLIDSPSAYRIYSDNIEAMRNGIEPLTVYRKSKPIDQDLVNGKKSVQHIIYLKLPEKLVEGAKYKIEFKAINTRETSVEFKFNSRENRSESIHVNQIGYRPDDTFKRAYLSLWLGNGGAYKYEIDSFEIIDDNSKKTVYSGKIIEGFPVSRPEKLKEDKNFVFTNVYYMDFNDFQMIGKFRIHVPGVGVSYPFEISNERSWLSAFSISMKGLLAHRSGIELGPPFSEYRRPRNMHPADGFKIFELEHTRLEGEIAIVRKELDQKIGNPANISKLKINSNAWGGYMDAGDWDRRANHLDVSYDLLELYQINPTFFAKVKLSLPPGETKDNIPDLVNECLWNIDCYARMQESDGGVRGGIESTKHPRQGEASWQETLLIGTFGPDPITSYSFAACSAKSARILSEIDSHKADFYRKKAILAWNWSEESAQKVFDEIKKRSPSFDLNQAIKSLNAEKLRAASELYSLTNDAKYHNAFKDLLGKIDPYDVSEIEIGAMFNYAMLSNEKSDPKFRNICVELIKRFADVAIDFGKNNAFNIHTRVPGLPMMGWVAYYSVPEMIVGPVLPRAYILTNDRKYLDAAIAAAHFSSGANPLNITFTVGVGSDYPRNPLHIDSRVSAQKAPEGITVYGPMDAQAEWGFNSWVHTWHLGDMFPNSHSWPAAEWYVDIFLWPAMCEYTVHQTFRPTAYYWGFLAARDKK
ncbi:MAG TPA: glycoside hydrolase family 9 protein [Victivallales bacterium]|nr:glycoside hydrolase family 9 protein [Victivallales bacterium]